MRILFEDEHILVCEKPPELVSEPNGSGQDVLTRAGELCGADLRLVHRLDRGTGGAMLLAKTAQAASSLSAAVRDRRLEKEYLAVLRGKPELPEARLEDLIFRDSGRNKSYVVKRQRKGVKKAALEYRLLDFREGLSLVRVRLFTGRTHQIRVQFSSRALPLYGDRRYGGGDGEMALWSARLCFPHPVSAEPLCLESSPPVTYPWSLFRDYI